MTTGEYFERLNGMLMSELIKNDGAMPPGFNKKRFALNCMTMIRDMMADKDKREKLLTIDFSSIIECMMKGAYLGLDFFNGECYAIPYGANKNAVERARREGTPIPKGSMNFQTDYKGEVKLCKKYSKNPIKDIFAKVVRDGDEFYEEIDSGIQKIYFRPQPFNNGEMRGAFAVATFADGSMIYETMSSEEIENVRNNYSKASNSPAWTKSRGEMYKKTVLRRLCKFIDLDFDNIEQMKAFEDGGDADFSQTLSAREIRQISMAEAENPADVMSQIRNAGAKKNDSVVPVHARTKAAAQERKQVQPQPVMDAQQSMEADYSQYEQQYAQFEQQYGNGQDVGPQDDGYSYEEGDMDDMPFT